MLRSTYFAPSFRALRTMVSTSIEDEEYEAAISALNGLQTNAAALEQIRQQKGDPPVSEYNRMQQYLQRVGLTPANLRRLNTIHVSGTKGKGSVCAMTESIMRCHGFKTGLYTSPHLLEVRERIRINGQPLSRSSFIMHFWDVYNKLVCTRHLFEDAMPSYFRFLTVMAFSVFLCNNVDVAVVEVGIGGTHDSTNIIEHPVVCGVASLGYDHTDILGSTLADIAWHKGGIFKEKCPAVTVVQAPEAMEALAYRAGELGAKSLHLAPPLTRYPGPLPELGLRGNHQHCNASLAAQLCHVWLQRHLTSSASSLNTQPSTSDGAIPMAQSFVLTKKFRDGLQQCKWPGRNQVVERGNVTYYLDGAHTPQSIEASAQWFLSEVNMKEMKPSALRVLLFNTTGHRNSHTFLVPLVACGFKYALFCPNIAQTKNSADQTNEMVTRDGQLSRCYANQQSFWEVINRSHSPTLLVETGRERLQDATLLVDRSVQTKVFTSVSDSIHFVETISSPRVGVHVLVCGSLHLVGTVMNVLGFTVDDV